MFLTFKWDPNKASANWKKHRVTFIDATTVFGDPLSITIEDPDHSKNEQRFVTIGLSRRGRTLVIVHTENEDEIRIISARHASKSEKKRYEAEL